MNEIINRFLNKDCCVHSRITATLDATTGIITEASDGWIIVKSVETDLETAINLDNVIKISEIPHKENGKRKIIY